MGKTLGAIGNIITSPLSLIDKDLGRTVSAIAITAIGAATGQAWLVGVGLSRLSKPGVPKATLSRLNLTFDPDATRKMVFGRTAGGTDLLYSEPSGEQQDYVDYVIAVAAHKVSAIRRIFIDDKVAWSSSGGVTSTFTGYLTVTAITEGSAGNAFTINGGTVWNATDCRMTGLAYVRMRVKRTGNSKKAESPFSGGLSGKLVIEVDGVPVYDPRKDSTRGGTGTHRADDQSTWDFTGGNNHALQVLTGLLGWRINGIVSVGAGVLPDRIDFADFAAGANICDEAVARAAGGTQRRYEGAGLISDDEDPNAALSPFLQACHGEFRDVNGKIGIRIAVNDLAGPVVAFEPGDVLGAYSFTGQNALGERPNIIRGRYVDPSDESIYQLVPYTEYKAASDDGIDRVATLDLPVTQDPLRARRIAKQALMRLRMGGAFQADYGPRAWAARVGDAVTQTFPMADLAGDIFRVERQEIRIVVDDEGAAAFCPMVLSRDHPDVYAWTPEEDDASPDAAIAPVSYDPRLSILAVIEGEIPPPIFP